MVCTCTRFCVKRFDGGFTPHIRGHERVPRHSYLVSAPLGVAASPRGPGHLACGCTVSPRYATSTAGNADLSPQTSSDDAAWAANDCARGEYLPTIAAQCFKFFRTTGEVRMKAASSSAKPAAQQPPVFEKYHCPAGELSPAGGALGPPTPMPGPRGPALTAASGVA